MKNRLSSSDHRFRTEFEECTIAPVDFDHRAHVRLAYSYLAENDTDAARFVEPDLDQIPRYEP